MHMNAAGSARHLLPLRATLEAGTGSSPLSSSPQARTVGAAVIGSSPSAQQHMHGSGVSHRVPSFSLSPSASAGYGLKSREAPLAGPWFSFGSSLASATSLSPLSSGGAPSSSSSSPLLATAASAASLSPSSGLGVPAHYYRLSRVLSTSSNCPGFRSALWTTTTTTTTSTPLLTHALSSSPSYFTSSRPRPGTTSSAPYFSFTPGVANGCSPQR